MGTKEWAGGCLDTGNGAQWAGKKEQGNLSDSLESGYDAWSESEAGERGG